MDIQMYRELTVSGAHCLAGAKENIKKKRNTKKLPGQMPRASFFLSEYLILT